MSSPLTKIGIIYTQVQQEEELIPKSKCHWSLRYAQKTWSKISFDYTKLNRGKIAYDKDAFPEMFEIEASLVEGQSLLQKDHKRRKEKGAHSQAKM